MASGQLIDDDENGNEEEQPVLGDGGQVGRDTRRTEEVGDKSGKNLCIHLIISAMKNDGIPPSH